MAEIISAIVNILYHMKLIGCYFFLVLFFIACAKDSSTQKFQSSRNNIVDVRGQIVAIELENPGISLYTYFQIVDKYLVFADWKGYDNLIHLFDKNNFEHVVSTVPDEKHGKFHVFDQGKRKLLSFDVDCLDAYPDYKFTIKTSYYTIVL